MEKTAYVSGNPFKVIKMMNGEDVLCKVLEEYKDALVIEYPMAVVKNQIVEQENHIVEHTGLQRWMNFTHDNSFVIDKQKIIGFGNLAPEVVVYYKMVSRKVRAEEDGITGDDEHDALVRQMQENVSKLEAILEDNDVEDSDKITHVQPNKTLH